jgi:hypothetical protein
MRLTEEQKQEIKDYIVSVPRFRETFNELYDHLVNSFENNEVEFSIDEVNRIVNADFGGFSEIVSQEKLYQKELSKKYNKHFRQEMLNTFKWPQLIGNAIVLALCLIMYHQGKSVLLNLKPMLSAIIILVYGIAIFGFSKIIRNKFKHAKYSILDNYFGYACSFGVIFVNPSIHALNKNNSFGIGDQARLLILLSVFFFCSVYVRAFIKFYKRKVSVLSY